MMRERVVLGAASILIACALGGTLNDADRLLAASPQAPASSSQAAAGTSQSSLIGTYCISCHNQKRLTAGLALDTKDLANPGRDAEVWEKVLGKLRMNAMPPPGLPRPDKLTTDAFVSSLETALDRTAAAHPYAGRTDALHRLNRSEYKNAVRDLLGLDIDVAALLPPDDADAHGLDNIASILSIPPTLLERYLSAAQKVSRRALGLPPSGPVTETYKVSEFAPQGEQLSDELPVGSRGGAAITHDFPVDGEYVIKLRLRRTIYEYIMGLAVAEQIQVRVDGELVKMFTVGGEDHGTPAPASFSGDVPSVESWEKYATGADAGLDVRVPVGAGRRIVGVSFVRKFAEPEHVIEQATNYIDALRDEMRPQSIASVAISGPYGTSARGEGEASGRSKVLACRPARPADEEPCARKVLTAIAQRAYRRPVTADEVQTLLGFFAEGRREGGFDAGLQFGLERVLADPNFLFRVEWDPAHLPANTAYRVSDLELASRLSFFLWSSLPDDELLGLARRGLLRQPAVLDRQVRRMVVDPRSKALVENFVGQWLFLRNVRNVTPDPDIFPDFDETLRESFHRETELFVESQFREDRSLVDLLSADYSFLNERLARHYQVPGIYGSYFRRVTFGRDNPRGGLLGQGSLLMVTSYPNRTSPVLRGKWVLDSLLGTPPPPPPPNVPGLKDRGVDGQPATVRARLEEHRKNPVCATCHSQMDPLGFALENFDAIGKWRTSEAGVPVDASGVLPSGAKFAGPAGLREALLGRREQFVRGLTERLLRYALGRELEPSDMPTVRKIVRDSAAHDYRWSFIMSGIVRSTPFTMRTSGPDSVKTASPSPVARR